MVKSVSIYGVLVLDSKPNVKSHTLNSLRNRPMDKDNFHVLKRNDIYSNNYPKLIYILHDFWLTQVTFCLFHILKVISR
jgi:hypothetical protein